jgi:hypothetical protein
MSINSQLYGEVELTTEPFAGAATRKRRRRTGKIVEIQGKKGRAKWMHRDATLRLTQGQK